MSNNSKETMQERMERLKREAEKAKETPVARTIAQGEDADTDFEKIAEAFAAMQPEHPQVKPEEVKVTLYIDAQVYAAFEKLCVARGDKKRNTNAALAEFVLKRYREMQEEQRKN